ncbi:Beta-1,3-galactosyltransferase 6 isoform 4 [Theobroma cacao]|uniref:Hexosyltransferase n=1 Tax=Theobroma cacao TaxID=3641 RepID=A0A061G2N6_THECC|nr:Beta-1,3-galactosyltransferase 6 isoform 4 [Theobroma cacao]
MGLSRPQKPGNGVSTRWVSLFCITSFFLGVLVVNRFLAISDPAKMDEEASSVKKHQRNELHPIVNCDKDASFQAGDILFQVSQTHDVIMTLDKTISSLEMQLAAARAAKADSDEGSPMVTKSGIENVKERQKVFFVMGVITAFSSRKRRDSIRETWMPQGLIQYSLDILSSIFWNLVIYTLRLWFLGKELMRLEKEKGIIMRFVIGHSATPGGVLDRAIDAEEKQHKDFLRLNHIEGYHELSSKTQIYFSTAVSKWDADFYIKVDDDVHVNLGMVGSTLARHRSKPRVYIGCMKSGPVLAQKGVKYHEPEYWKFGEEGNKYFRHATGQIYAISKDLATYISVNRHILHRYANEDVSLGSWFIGLDVEHIDDRSLCCGTPPDCEWKAQAGNPCAASFDWSCSGICKSVERMEEVHQRCGEGDEAIWHTSF